MFVYVIIVAANTNSSAPGLDWPLVIGKLRHCGENAAFSIHFQGGPEMWLCHHQTRHRFGFLLDSIWETWLWSWERSNFAAFRNLAAEYTSHHHTSGPVMLIMWDLLPVLAVDCFLWTYKGGVNPHTGGAQSKVTVSIWIDGQTIRGFTGRRW